MTDEPSPSLPLDVEVGEAGPHATDAFALLGDETRVAILLALWEAYDPHAVGNALRFSELFDRVDYDDPGSFSYHLQQLSGPFVRHHPDGGGYELRVAGLRFIQAIIAGVGVEDADRGATEVDQPCPFCDAPTAIAYRDGLVVHLCTSCAGVSSSEVVDGFLNAVPFDPAGIADRSPDEVRAASRVAAWHQTRIMADGLCPACSGRVDAWLDVCPDHLEGGLCATCGTRFRVLARFTCPTCKNHNVSSPKALAMFHPAVTALYETHGISTEVDADDPASVRRAFDRMDGHEVEVIQQDPPRATVTAAVGGEAVELTVDESAQVRVAAR